MTIALFAMTFLTGILFGALAILILAIYLENRGWELGSVHNPKKVAAQTILNYTD